MSEPALMAACATHGISLNAADYAACEKIFDGTLLKKLLALVEKYGPQIAVEMPAIMADIAAGNYLAALMLLLSSLAGQTPTTPAA